MFGFVHVCFIHLHRLSIFIWTGPEGVGFSGCCPAIPPQSACYLFVFNERPKSKLPWSSPALELRAFPLSLYQNSFPLHHRPPMEYSSLLWKPWFDYCHRKGGTLSTTKNGKPFFLTHIEVLVAIPASDQSYP